MSPQFESIELLTCFSFSYISESNLIHSFIFCPLNRWYFCLIKQKEYYFEFTISFGYWLSLFSLYLLFIYRSMYFYINLMDLKYGFARPCKFVLGTKNLFTHRSRYSPGVFSGTVLDTAVSLFYFMLVQLFLLYTTRTCQNVIQVCNQRIFQ